MTPTPVAHAKPVLPTSNTTRQTVLEAIAAYTPAEQPRARATHAYGLLTDTCKAILAEPRRFNMHNWYTEPLAFVPTWDKNGCGSDYIAEQFNEMPACGTVACLAGWVVVLSRPEKTDRYASDTDMMTVSARAFVMLGAAHKKGVPKGLLDDLTDLFTTTSAWPMKIGTVEYAEWFVARLKVVQKKYAKYFRTVDLAAQGRTCARIVQRRMKAAGRF